MASLALNASTYLVGPRARFADRAGDWELATQFSAGYDGLLNDADRPTGAEALLPWKLIDDAEITFLIVLAQPNATTGDFDFTVLGTPTVARVTPRRFTTQLRAEIASAVAKLAADSSVDLSVDPTRGGVQEACEDVRLLPAILQTLCDLPAPIARELRAVCSTRIAATDVPSTLASGSKLLVVPRRIADARILHRAFEVADGDATRPEVVAGVNQPVFVVRYTCLDDPAQPPVRVRTPGVEVGDLSVSHEALATYWLNVANRTGASLSDLDERIAKATQPEVFLADIEPEALGRQAKPVDDTLVELDRLALAKTLLRAVRNLATTQTRLSTATGQGEVESERRGRIHDVLKELRNATNAASPMSLVRQGSLKLVDVWWEKNQPQIEQLANELAGLDPSTRWTFPDMSSLSMATIERELPESDSAAAVVALPGEAIDLVVGPEHLRLRHETVEAGHDGGLDQIGGFGILVRRAADLDQLATQPWSLGTASVLVIDRDDVLEAHPRIDATSPTPELAWDDEVHLHGITATFSDDVMRADLRYDGSPITAPSPLRFVHRERLAAGSEGPTQLAPLRYESVGALAASLDHRDRSRTPPLRYGDWYEIAAFAIDRAGGLPAELAEGSASTFKWSALADPSLNPPASEFIRYLRRVPVGDINVVPGGLSGPGEWPAPPRDVVLRATEWFQAQGGETESTPAILLSREGAWKGPLPGTRLSFDVTLSAPQIDEFTLARWAMPPKGADVAALSALKQELVRIYRDRDAQLAAPDAKAVPLARHAQLLASDPAVVAIGIRVTFVSERFTNAPSPPLVIPFLRSTPFKAEPLGLRVTSGPADDVTPLPNWVVVTVAEGHFARIELGSLLDPASWSRFDPAAMADLIESDPWTSGGIDYRAFRTSTLLVECATVDLPDKAALYNAFRLSPREDGSVCVEFRPDAPASIAYFANVDRFTLRRQRWTWRNTPLLLGEGVDADATPDEKRRLAASGLPADLWKLTTNVAPDESELVMRFDTLAVLDRGLVDRGEWSHRWPRAAAGEPAQSTDLTLDDRDAINAADYLRYGLVVRSRYAGVFPALPGLSSERIAEVPGPRDWEPMRRWRRIVMPYRGDRARLKPPRVLAVLPLTRDPDQLPPMIAPGDIGTQATPFLVILDETWFRECGHGEALEARVVPVAKEIGDPPDDAPGVDVHYRAGPLPDLWTVSAGKRFVDGPDEGVTGRFPLSAFGPFGYSLDRTGNEALSNASAFVLWVPPGASAQWWLGVRFRRVLYDAPNSAPVARSDDSEVWNLYTTRGSQDLLRGKARQEPVHIVIKAEQAFIQGLAPDQLMPIPSANRRVREGYAYALLIGRASLDRGTGFDMWVPEDAAWIGQDGRLTGLGANNHQAPKWVTDGQRYRGMMIEIVLNGRHPVPDPATSIYPTSSPLYSRSDSLRALFKALLPSADEADARHDANGMIRRVSAIYSIRTE